MSRWHEDHHYARLAARLLAPPPASEAAAPDGARTVDALAAALLARSQRRKLRQRLYVAGAAAALVALTVGGLTVSRHRPAAITARGEDGAVLAEGSQVEAGAAATRVTLSTGTELRLQPGARLVLAELGARQRLLLRSGRVEARVTPLSAGHRFLLDTADTEVEVHGTRFDVAVLPPPACEGSMTTVEVHEGVVTVRREDQQWRLAAGQRWPSGCEREAAALRADMPGATAPAASVPVRVPGAAVPRAKAAGAVLGPTGPAARSPSPATRSRRGGARGPSAATPEVAVPAPTPSTLAAQNDLFASALAARRRGQLGQARALLDQLMAHYPFGPLAETARQERAKLDAVESTASERGP